MFLKTKKQIFNTLFIGIALPIAIVSCGGSDSSTAPAANIASITNATIPTQQVTLDNANAAVVADNVLNVLPTTNDFSGTATSVSAAEFSASTPNQSVVNLTNRVFNQLKNSQTESSVLGAVTSACDSGSKSEPNIPTTGSFNGSYTFSYNNCKIGNSIIDGSLNFNGSVTLDSASNLTNLDFTVTFTNLTFREVGFAASIDGAFTIIYSDINGAESFSFTGKRLTFKDDIDAFEIKDFKIVATSDISEETFDVNYTISSTLIGGSLAVNTGTTFKQTIGKPFPYQGQMTITGADGSICTLTVNSGGTGSPDDFVTLDVTTNGILVSTQVQWKNLK